MTASPNTPRPEAAESANKVASPIEIGLVLAGPLDEIDREAVGVARERVSEKLEHWFPEFAWRIVVVKRAELMTPRREEPVAFLSQAQAERDLHKWDSVLVITSSELVGHYKPFALAAVSRTLDLAIVSTARVDPHAVDDDAERLTRIDRVGQRLSVLILACLGHLNGLDHADDQTNLMWDADDTDELDRMNDLSTEQVAKMRSNLLAIADLRLEEQRSAATRSQIAFVAQAAWTQRREIVAAVLEARPWQFPVRLSRLTTAAASAMIVLLMTAETWDMAMNQPASSVIGLQLTAVVITTAYIATRQQLLVRRQDRLMTEQIAVSNIAATMTVLCGLLTVLAGLFAASLLMSLLLYPVPLIEGWAASLNEAVGASHHLLLSGTISALSLCIGTLGAAFEDQSYFRHVTFIDEEL